MNILVTILTFKILNPYRNLIFFQLMFEGIYILAPAAAVFLIFGVAIFLVSLRRR